MNGQSAPITLIQHVGKDAGTTRSSSLAFATSNTAGNWIAVAIRAGKVGQTFTVTDTRGNTYRRAVQLNETVDRTTLALFYAESIAGGPNTVTVSDTIAGGTLRFAILEYAGIALANSLDVTASAQGTSAVPNSGTVTTTGNGELVVGVISTAKERTFVAGSGFVIRDRVPAAPSTKLVTEDLIQPAAGPVSASATLNGVDDWGALVASFRPRAGGPVTGPSIASVNPTSGVAGTSITISGTNFGATQGTSTVTFNGTIATATSWNATNVAVPVPNGATSGNVVVTVGGQASNGVPFTVLSPAPSIASLNPTSGVVGTPVTITGTNFGATQGTSTVRFNGTAATPTSWSSTSLVVPVPTGATSGNVVVTVGGQASNGVSFSVPPATGGITLVQHTGKDAGTTTSSSLAFTTSNTAGNWIAVAIRAGQIGQTFTITDARGNTYRRAVQLNETVDGTTLALYYAENIASGSNTVTVSDTIAGGTLRFAILEYAGVAPTNSLDVAASAQGTSVAPNSGPVTTTTNGDLVIGMISTANERTFAAGSGFTIQDRVPEAPNTKLVTETLTQPAAGPVSASATLNAADNWGAMVAAFRAANSPPRLTITQPAAGTTIFGTTVNVTYTAAGNLTEVNHVHFRLDSNAEVMDLTFDGVYQFTNVTTGAHTLTGYLVRGDHSKINGTDASVAFSTVLPDTTNPTVALTAPGDGATVSGLLTVSATAADNVGLAGVQFVLDAVTNLGAEDTTPAYAVFFDTTTVANGPHTLTAVARDLAGNRATSTPVSVTIANTNPNDPSRIGQWAGPSSWPIVAIHAALMPNGKVLLWDNHTDGSGVQVWDPITSTMTPRNYSFSNLFCAGLTTLGDGKPILIGGHLGAYVGTRDTAIFNPVTQTWLTATPMSYPRWYPTATMLPSGRVLALSGAIDCPECRSPTGSRAGIAEIPEIYDPTSNTWTTLPSAGLSLPLYPHVFVLPDGRVLVSSTHEDPIASKVLNVGTQTWTTVDPKVTDGGSAAMYLPGKVMKSGTGRNPDYPSAPSAATTYVLDMNQSSPRWRPTANMAFPRTQHNLTLLPDGTVLATGGSRDSNVNDQGPAVLEAELWSPLTETWSTLSGMQTPRMYHSIALLLPDGRVLAAGGGRFGIDEPSAELFSPPYLFKGPRPTITSAPTVVAHGATFFVQTPDGARVGAVSMIRAGAVTHAINMGQVYVPLTFQVVTGGVNVQGPANSNVATPGEYMLFLLDTNGVPSVARFFRMAAPGNDAEPPSPPSGVAATGAPGVVDLSWTASTDNVNVTGYGIHRATTPGIVPTIANRIGQASVTSYSDTGFSAGTYYYVVTAQDAAGNVSGASNEVSITVAADTTPPTVSLTSPAPGAIVSGLITVTADAADDVGVAGVRPLLDGSPLGPEDTTSPYTFSWTTASAGNGIHQLSAVARDVAGNTRVAAEVSVTISNQQPSGLVAAYSFNEGAGSIVADASGHANTGSINGATWTPSGRFGSALQFNGTSSRVVVPDSPSLDLANGMTLKAWVYLTAPPSGWSSVVDKDVDRYYLMASSNQIRPVVGGTFGSTNLNVQGPAALPLNTWTHLAATYDRINVRLYVNGAQVAVIAQTAAISTSNSVLTIGANFYGEYFTGLIDEVRIYDRALTPEEIQADASVPIEQSSQAANLGVMKALAPEHRVPRRPAQ